MSHFTVMVIGDNIEEQLAPFQENNMDNCPKEYLTFNDVEEECLNRYNTDTTTKVKTPSGDVIDTSDKRLYVKTGEHCSTYTLPEGFVEIEVPLKDEYATFEEFVQEYEGHDTRDEETGKYGYWENPNRKWDWYQVGGRWTGFFKLKSNDVEHKVGKPGLLTGIAEEGYADSVKKKHIDFDAMRNEKGDKARKSYKIVEKFFGGKIPTLEYMWADFHMNDDGIFKDLSRDEQRERYHSQAPLLQLKNSYDEIKKLPKEEGDILLWIDLEDYQCTEDEYVQRARNSAITTFALVKDGIWYERGEMGWWGCVGNEKDKTKWDEEFYKVLDNVDDETILTVVDCHI